MKKERWLFAMALLMSLVFCYGLTAFAKAKEVPRLTKEELKEKLGQPDVAIIDVRTGSDWNSSDVKIKGAVREDNKKVKEWATKYDKNKTIVLYCA